MDHSTMWYSVPSSAGHKFYVGTSDIAIINTTGVGIGIGSPGEKLDVHGSARFGIDGKLTINSRSTTFGSETVALQTTIDNRYLSDANPGTHGGESRNVLALQPDGGYVGIGTTIPLAKLRSEEHTSELQSQ